MAWKLGRPSSGTAAALVFVAALLAACGDSPTSTPGAPSVRAAILRETASPLVRELRILLPEPAGVRVDFWSDRGPRLRVEADAAGEAHRLLLGRLRPGATYHYEARATSAGSEGPATAGSFATDPLPEDLAALDFSAEGSPTEPLTVLEINRNVEGFEGLVILDEEGEVVWFFRAESPAGVTTRSNGSLVVLSGSAGLLEVAPTGEVVAELPQSADAGARMHHDVIATPDNTLLFIALDTRPFEGREVSGESIWEWDPETGFLERRWSAWDHLSPALDRGPASSDDDWLHANSLALGPSGNVLMSFRFTDQVISIAPDFAELEWRLGGINADVAVSGESVFVGQHTAAELPAVDGRRRVLLFDNGPGSRGWSRALELELDLEAGVATRAWEFRPTPDNFSFITSLARRLPGGNTFVAFGAGPGVLGSSGPVAAYEVDPEGNVRFRLEVGGAPVSDGFVLYRAWPLGTLAGERRVD